MYQNGTIKILEERKNKQWKQHYFYMKHIFVNQVDVTHVGLFVLGIMLEEF